MDPAIEFSAQLEQEQLHRKFIGTLRFFFYSALAGMFCISFFSDGGNDARWLPFFLLSAFITLNCEMLATAKRLGRGALVSTGFLIFLPWIVFQAINALFLSPFPHDAMLILGINFAPLILFFIAQQQSRSSGTQGQLLAATLILLLAGAITGIAYEIYQYKDFSGSLTTKIFSGFLSDPAATGGASVLVVFASLALMLRRGSSSRSHLVSIYCGVVALCLILLTRNTAVWLSALAGGIVFSALFLRKKATRSILVVLLACGIAVAPIFSEMPFSVPAATADVLATGTETSDNIPDAEAPSRLGLQKTALKIFSENPVLGAGTASFKSEFRKIAEPQWQLNPETSNNLYTWVLAENGLIGFLLLFVPAGFVVYRGVRVCLAIPHDHKQAPARPHGDDTKFHNSNTRSLLASLLGGIAACGVLVGLDYSPSFLPVILGIAVFGGIVAHETAPAGFGKIVTWHGNRRKAAFATAVLLPAAIFSVFVPASYSAAQCETGKRLIAPFLQNFYERYVFSDQKLNSSETEHALLSAVAASGNNAEAWIALAQLYTLSAYSSPEHIRPLANAIDHAATRACAAAPELTEARLFKAIAEILLGNKKSAQENLEEVDRLAPNDLPILFQVADAYRMLSEDRAPPKNILKRLTSIAPNAPRVRQMNSIADLTIRSRDTDNRQADTAEQDQSLFEF